MDEWLEGEFVYLFEAVAIEVREILNLELANEVFIGVGEEQSS
jgi:hypothetical protein